MKLLSKYFAGQSLLSWLLQVALICLAWLMFDHHLQNNLTTILIVTCLTILTYMSLAKDHR